MQKKLFVEKKTKYADAARRLFRSLTEDTHIYGTEEVRILHCFLLDGWQDEMLPGLLASHLWDEATEVLVPMDAVAEDASHPDTLCVAVTPLFRRPAERMTEEALRMACGRFLGEQAAAALHFRQAEVVLIRGELSSFDRARIREILINPASSAEIRLFTPGFLPPLAAESDTGILTVRGFRRMDEDTLFDFGREGGYRMSPHDLRFVQSYFRVEEKRDPTFMELRMIDVFWSDHCRHTTFMTALQDLKIEDRDIGESFDMYLQVREALYGTRPKNVTLSDIATVAETYLKHIGRVPQALEVSIGGDRGVATTRIPVCPIHPEAQTEDAHCLLHFGCVSHSYPTEKEPYLGAGACFDASVCGVAARGGTVIGAMRLSGNGVPQIQGEHGDKLSPAHIAEGSAEGVAAFSALCGVPVGLTAEWLHPGYGARHMEACFSAAVGAEDTYPKGAPVPGDVILLIGAPTGRDGVGGTLHTAGPTYRRDPADAVTASNRYTAPVGDAAVTRSLLRLLRAPEAGRLIKRAQSVGPGGLGFAASNLAGGVRIDLDAVPTYTIDQTESGDYMTPFEIASSETRGRILIVTASIHMAALMRLAAEENLPAALVGIITAERRFRMVWRERSVLSLSRDLLESTGAEKRLAAYIPATDTEALGAIFTASGTERDPHHAFYRVMRRPDVSVRTPPPTAPDATVGGGCVLYPYSGRYLSTALDIMAERIPDTHTAAVFSYGFSPAISEISPYHGAYLAVLTAICRLTAAGVPLKNTVLSRQVYFPTVDTDPTRYGTLLAAMLGAFRAQMDYEVAIVSGSDSISGTDAEGDVPPSFIAIGVAHADEEALVTPEWKLPGSRVYLLSPAYGENGLPDPEDERGLLHYISRLHREGKLRACAAVGSGGVAATLSNMCFGNHLGFNFEHTDTRVLFEERPGAFLVETDEPLRGILLGHTKDHANILIGAQALQLSVLQKLRTRPGDKRRGDQEVEERGIVAAFPYQKHSTLSPAVIRGDVRVLIPVLPGISGEDALAARFAEVGMEVETPILLCRTPKETRASLAALVAALSRCHILALGGGGYPDYSCFADMTYDPAARFFHVLCEDPAAKEALLRFRDTERSLILGVGQGFRMLMACDALSPVSDLPAATRPTIDHNRGGIHRAQAVRTGVMSVSSPWMRYCETGDIYTLPVSSNAGRCLLPDEEVLYLAKAGRIASQYVNADGNPTMDATWNPFGSDFAVEGIFSADGRILGRMAHSEYVSDTLCKNIQGLRDQKLFRAAADYYKRL